MDEDWLLWKALVSVAAVPFGFGIAAGVLYFLTSFWPYGKDATLGAAATIAGAAIAFGGISWQIRATFEAQRQERRAAREERAVRVARPLIQEVRMHNWAIAWCFAGSDDEERVARSQGMHHALVREAFDRLHPSLDDLHDATAAQDLETHYGTLTMLHAMLDDDAGVEGRMHALTLVRTTTDQVLRSLGPIAELEV